MRKFKKILLLLSVPFAISLAACTPNKPADNPGDNTGEKQGNVTAISLNKTSLSLTVGSFEELEVTLTPETANVDLVWTIDKTDIASADDGFIIAKKAGTAVIKVAVKGQEEQLSATCTLTVTDKEVLLAGLNFSEEDHGIMAGETFDLSTLIGFIPSNATQRDLTWSSDNEEYCKVDNKGVITGVKAGTANITATGANQKSATIAIQVRDPWVDYASQAKLNLDYKGKTFDKDGIEEVSLLTPIDGDTAHFTPKNGGGIATIKSRFFGIDTPESTGKVQPYGSKASKFTKNILRNAKTIVVSSPSTSYQAPSPDSTGSRYVSLVWASEKENAAYDELILVNLQVAQEGLCLVKTDDEFTIYNDIFRKADTQAHLWKKNMHSGEPDPDFNYSGDYQDVSLLDLKREVELSLQDSSHVNKFDQQKVRVTGSVVSYVDNMLYIADYYPNDEDDPSKGGEYAGINIFCGMSVINDKFQPRNTYISVCGLCKDDEIFGFQITDTQGRWNPSEDEEFIGKTDCRVIYTAEENTEEHQLAKMSYTASELNAVAKANDTSFLYCYVEVTTPLEVNYVYVNDDKDITLGFKDVDFNCYIPFMYKGYPEEENAQRWDTEEDFMGKKLLIKGCYSYHKTTSGRIRYQIAPANPEDVVVVNEQQ